ncbi:hypothetical protein B7Z17_00720 [Candidatus Saccharibacteria bacterium 32-49-10]|nr:MAG: hypothetical protein B7Z17_00720 [Candidatus Saccharibacteria bacterium 32-49-10]
MKKNHSTIFRVLLVILDCFALLAAFTVAYILRVTLDPRPFSIQIGALEFIATIFTLLPIWIVVFYLFRLYDRPVYTHPIREFGRLLLAAIFGVMIMISVGFFTDTALFPTKLVAFYAIIASFLIMLLLRVGANYLRMWLLGRGRGVQKVLIIGNSPLTHSLAQYIMTNSSTGFEVTGVVARKEFIPKEMQALRATSFKSALSRLPIDAIIQTDHEDISKNFELASKHYLEFYQAPTFEGMLTAKRSVEIIDASPLIKIHSTPLTGYGRVVKRLMDIVLGTLGLIVASPIMLIIAALIKITDPQGPVFMRGKMQKRLTRYNRPFNIYKFRSHYAKFDGKTDEEVFEMIGKPELIKQYRANGDKLDYDFRVTPVGRFIRRFSLDELPQLINVVKGDISLVGPRALVPHELSSYDKKHALLAVKSGLTGLAVVSGRRSISFDERRRLDLYYAQNWSVWMDISILFKTILVIFKSN